MFCAPSAMPLPARTVATSVSHGKGGQTTNSRPLEANGSSARARAVASSRVVFIFQLPTMSALATRPNRHGAGGESAGAILNCLCAPAIDLREILHQLEAIARHAQQLLFALRDAEIRRAAARHPGEVAQRADALPVLFLTNPHFGEPIGAWQQGCDQL